jgi:hypothetical protein
MNDPPQRIVILADQPAVGQVALEQRLRFSTSLAAIERTGQVSWPLRLAPRQT